VAHDRKPKKDFDAKKATGIGSRVGKRGAVRILAKTGGKQPGDYIRQLKREKKKGGEEIAPPPQGSRGHEWHCEWEWQVGGKERGRGGWKIQGAWGLT